MTDLNNIQLPDNQPVTLVVPAYPVAEGCGDEPTFAEVELTPELVATLNKLKTFVSENNLAWVVSYDSVEKWGPHDCRLISDTMCTSATNFWLCASVKHGDYDINTAGIDFSLLKDAFMPDRPVGPGYQWIDKVLFISSESTQLHSEYVAWKNSEEDDIA